MADSDSGVAVQQQQRRGRAHNVTAAKHHRVFAVNRNLQSLQHLNATLMEGKGKYEYDFGDHTA